MRNMTQFKLTETEAGVGAADAPKVFRLRQRFPRPVERDVAAAVWREIEPFVQKLTAASRKAAVSAAPRLKGAGGARRSTAARTDKSAYSEPRTESTGSGQRGSSIWYTLFALAVLFLFFLIKDLVGF
jgi:hypothetical protein